MSVIPALESLRQEDHKSKATWALHSEDREREREREREEWRKKKEERRKRREREILVNQKVQNPQTRKLQLGHSVRHLLAHQRDNQIGELMDDRSAGMKIDLHCRLDWI
jgi:hypothetical protein